MLDATEESATVVFFEIQVFLRLLKKIASKFSLLEVFKHSHLTVETDNFFPLKNYLIKRYLHRHLTIEQQNFNHKLSRVRQVVKSDFGIRASRFPFT